MLPRAEVAAAVPVPLVVPPADSTVRLIELSTVPVTVSVPLLVAAEALSAVNAEIAATARNVFIVCFSFADGVRGRGEKIQRREHVILSRRRRRRISRCDAVAFGDASASSRLSMTVAP